MTGWEAAFLGIIQGLTEFLPISSSGHLVLAKSIFDVEETGIAFEIFVHFGTLMAVVTVFRRDIGTVFREFSHLFRKNKSAPAEEASEGATGSRLLIFLMVGTVPAAILGYLFKDVFEGFFSDPVFVCGALIITGVILLVTKFAQKSPHGLSYSKSFFIGLSQVVAFFPGISRSGTTISAGLFFGLQPVESARFSFLLAVPLIFGVTVIKSAELIAVPPSSEQIFSLILGSIFAYLSGLLAIKWLLGVVQRSRIDRFAYYCFGVGLLGLVLYRFELL